MSQFLGREIRAKAASDQAHKWYAQHKAGKTISQISRENINPQTGRPFSREWVYSSIKKFVFNK